jgi:hypothetical protein
MGTSECSCYTVYRYPPVSSNKQETNVKAGRKQSFNPGLFFDPEVGGDIYLRKVSWLSTDYAALYL